MLAKLNSGSKKASMEAVNSTGILRLSYACRWACLATGLLMGGCSHATRKTAPPPPAPPHQAVVTGIPACDAYLSSYLTCHRAAGTYNDATLQTHYQAMTQSLQHDANDPLVRPYLNDRCMGLTQQMTAALNGRSCSAQAPSTQPANLPPSATPPRT
jgi:hypothetical protein